MNNDLATIRQEIRDLTRLAHSGRESDEARYRDPATQQRLVALCAQQDALEAGRAVATIGHNQALAAPRGDVPTEWTQYARLASAQFELDRKTGVGQLAPTHERVGPHHHAGFRACAAFGPGSGRRLAHSQPGGFGAAGGKAPRTGAAPWLRLREKASRCQEVPSQRR